MLRIYFYFFVSINFLGLTSLFIVCFLNIIYIREEFIEIPVIKSSNSKNFIIPNEVKNDEYNFKILDHDHDNFPEKLNSKNIEFGKNKVISNQNSLYQKNSSKKEIKKYIVQLGVFKNKKNADNQLFIINNQKKLLFEEVQIKLSKTNNNNNIFYYIETDKITKINAINLCTFFKKKKINCIIKIRK